jgi:hypothetical protein
MPSLPVGLLAQHLIRISLSMPLQPFVGPWPLFQFLNPIHSRQDSLGGGSARRKALPAHRKTQTQNKRTPTSIPRVGFKPTIPLSERAKTAHALDRVTTVIGVLLKCQRTTKVLR